MEDLNLIFSGISEGGNYFDFIFYLVENSNDDCLFEMLKVYLDHYPEKIMIEDGNGYTPLLLACRRIEKHGNIRTVKYLLEKSNSVVNDVDKNYIPPLVYSCLVNSDTLRMELSKLLLENGANPNQKDVDGNSPIHIATNNSDIELLELFTVDYNGDIDIRDCYGETPLMISASREETEIVKFLLENGANPNLKNFHGESLLEILDENYLSDEKVDIISMLLNNEMFVDFFNTNQTKVYEKYMNRLQNKNILSIKETFEKRIEEIESKLEILKSLN